MFIIIRVLVIVAGAHAGSAVASIQFPDLLDCNQAARKHRTEGACPGPSSSKAILAVTTFSYRLSGISAFALVRLLWRRQLCLSDDT